MYATTMFKNNPNPKNLKVIKSIQIWTNTPLRRMTDMTDRHVGRQTNKQTDRQTDRMNDKWADYP